MTEYTTNRTSTRPSRAFYMDTAIPAVLVAAAPPSATETDRFRLSVPFSAGRSSDNTLAVRDDKVSKRHFKITHYQSTYWLEDLGSTNGTFVQGEKVNGKVTLSSGAVIRAGRIVLVFHNHSAAMLTHPDADNFGMAGKFHIGPLIARLREAARSDRPVLLVGDTGTGKELAARALAQMMGSGAEPMPLLAQNCGQFISEEAAKSTIFGVGKRVFSSVDDRPGLLEEANGGVLFLDEIHRLPDGVKGSLLRFVQDGVFFRAGETKARVSEARVILATNTLNALPHDLTPRLRVESIPSLANRVADIPSIFNTVLSSALKARKLPVSDVIHAVRADHYESLCLDRFQKENIRGLKDLADRIATRYYICRDPGDAVVHVFTERFRDGPVARRRRGDETGETGHYECHKAHIIQVYDQCKHNISKTERRLQSEGIGCSRRWLSKKLREWGVKM